MKVIKIHRREMGEATILVKECPTIWITSSTNKSNPTVVRRCSVRYKKKDYRTIGKLVAHIIGDEQGVYEYINSLGAVMKVRCSYKEYLFLKLNYGADGLTDEELMIYNNL